MTVQEALEIMDKIAETVQADRASHAKIQEALDTLKVLVEKDPLD